MTIREFLNNRKSSFDLINIVDLKANATSSSGEDLEKYYDMEILDFGVSESVISVLSVLIDGI